MSLYKLERAVRTARRAQSAYRDPGRYARNRAITYGLGAVGLWRLLRRLYR